MSKREPNPAKAIALLALQADETREAEMLEDVATYAFEQLRWRRTEGELDTLLFELGRSMEQA